MLKMHFPKLSLDQEPTGREKIFFAVAVIGLFVLFLNLLWSPIANKVAAGKVDLNNMTVQTEGMRKLIETTKQALTVQTLEKNQGAPVNDVVRRILDRKVVDPLEEIHNVVALLGSRKLSRNTKIDDVSVGQTVEKDNYSMVPISVRLTGRYGAIQGYFTAIEGSEMPLLIRRFTLSADAGGSISASIDVELYIIKRAG